MTPTTFAVLPCRHHCSYNRPATAAAVDLAFPALLRSDFRAGARNSLGGEETRFINLDAMKHRASVGCVRNHDTLILKVLVGASTMEGRACWPDRVGEGGYTLTTCACNLKEKSRSAVTTSRTKFGSMFDFSRCFGGCRETFLIS